MNVVKQYLHLKLLFYPANKKYVVWMKQTLVWQGFSLKDAEERFERAKKKYYSD